MKSEKKSELSPKSKLIIQACFNSRSRTEIHHYCFSKDESFTFVEISHLIDKLEFEEFIE